MVVDLRRVASHTTEAPAAKPPARRFARDTALATLAIVIATVAAALWWSLAQRPGAPPPRREYTQLTNFADSATQPVLSPDGRMIAFVRGPDTFINSGQIYLQLLESSEPV